MLFCRLAPPQLFDGYASVEQEIDCKMPSDSSLGEATSTRATSKSGEFFPSHHVALRRKFFYEYEHTKPNTGYD